MALPREAVSDVRFRNLTLIVITRDQRLRIAEVEVKEWWGNDGCSGGWNGIENGLKVSIQSSNFTSWAYLVMRNKLVTICDTGSTVFIEGKHPSSRIWIKLRSSKTPDENLVAQGRWFLGWPLCHNSNFVKLFKAESLSNNNLIIYEDIGPNALWNWEDPVNTRMRYFGRESHWLHFR